MSSAPPPDLPAPAVDALLLAARERRLVVFCGAGISMLPPSRAPGWWEIYAATAHALRDRLCEGFALAAAEVDVDTLLKPLSTQHLADIVSTRFAGPTFASLLAVVDVADANENHRTLAGLAAAGALRAIVTTNFDTLIERAAAVRGAALAIAAPGIEAAASPGRRCTLVKLHGTTVDSPRMLETSAQKAREASPALRRAWAGLLSGADVLVLGYSGADLGTGAARAFFDDVVAAGGRIWWPHLPGHPPQLTDDIRPHVTPFEAGLPEPLRCLRQALGEADCEMPVHGLDAQVALKRAVDDWSRGLHVGRWAAATFFLALCERAGTAADALHRRLMDMAAEQVPRFTPPFELALEDMAAPIFLGAAGARAMESLQLDLAQRLHRAALNVFLGVDTQLAGQASSQAERHANLASAWNNWALTQLLAGAVPQALNAFHEALRRAYLAGAPGALLIALGNILHHGLELREVRRCMRLAEAAAAVADRVGAVHAAIELRLLLACYATERNEIWLARAWLLQARQRAAALGSMLHLRLADVQLADGILRQGRVAEGLSALAAAVGPKGNAAFLHRPVVEISRRLAIMGIAQPHVFGLSLPAAELPGQVATIAAERARASAAGEPPWKGAHCSVSGSAAVDDGELHALWSLGALEFDGDAPRAVATGLRIAEVLAGRGHHVEARWAARNQLHRPALPADDACRAHAVMAECAAALGRLDEARQHLGAADALRLAGAEPPPALCHTGLWFHLQAGEAGAAGAWAAALVDGVLADRKRSAELIELTAKLAGWGKAAAPALAEVQRGLQAMGLSAGPAAFPAEPYRPYAGATRLLDEPRPDLEPLLRRAAQALQQGDATAAQAVLDEVAGAGQLPEAQAGVAMALQMQALAAELDADALEALADTHRQRLLPGLNFSALARVEATLMWSLVGQHKAVERAAGWMARHGWLAQLAEDPIARASLEVWDSMQHALAGQGSVSLGERARGVLATAGYFGLPEAPLADIGLDADAPGPTPSPAEAEAAAAVAQALAALRQRFDAATDPADADAALREQVGRLRGARLLTRHQLARMRGDRAGWALAQRHLPQAAALYRRVGRSFALLGDVDAQLNAMAGEARARSRSADHAGAVAVFEQALALAGSSRRQANLWLGLGSAHLLQGTERSAAPDTTLLDRALEAFDHAIRSAGPDTLERALARLARARTLGERGDQQQAMDALDLATGELAHQGHPWAKVLLEHREQWAAGQWRTLTLF